MADGDFDLLQAAGVQENRMFRVTFDFFTPRAHFIILPRGQFKQKWRDLADLDSAAKDELLAAANSMVTAYGLVARGERPMLSVHRGSWVTNANVFHVHLCVGVDTYLAIFNRNKSALPNWPSPAYVTKQWKASKDPKDYDANVRGYPYKSYVKEEIKETMKLRPRTEGIRYFRGTELLHDRNQPSIGLNAGVGLETMEKMEDFAKENRWTTPGNRDSNMGCHICIGIGAALLHDGVQVSGYVQLSGPTFYELCPAERRAAWLRNFQRWDGKIYS